MATVIDALVISLGLDPREYEKKSKQVQESLKKFSDASAKQSKLIAQQAKTAAKGFSALKIEVLGALAALGIGDGFKSFIQSSMNAQASAGRTAEALGISVQSMRAYGLMARWMGESGDAAVGTLNRVAAGLAAARRGDISFIATANKYGANIGLDDNVETTMSKLNKMAYLIKQKYGEQQAIGVLGEIGITDRLQAIQLTEDPAKRAQDHAEAMRRVGVWTPQQIAQNEKLQRQWGNFLNDMDNLRAKIANDIEPALIKLGEQFDAWVNSGGLDRLTAKLDKFFDQLQKVVDALGGVKGILIEIAAIKVFGWIASIAGWALKLQALTGALAAAKAAAAGGAVADAAGAAAGAAGGAGGAAAGAGKGLFSKLLGGSLLLRSLWTAAWAPRPEESPAQFKARVDAMNKKFDADHPEYEKSSYWGKWKTVFGALSSPQTQSVIAGSGTIDRSSPERLFSELEKKNGLPAGLLSSIYSAESSRGKNLVSPKGAQGPFQFMPGTAADYGLHGSDVFDTDKSATAAARYLHDLLKQFNGNVQDAVAAYNWGPGNVARRGLMAMPQETANYLQKVLGALPPPGVPSGVARGAAVGAGQTTNTNSVSIGTMNVNAPNATNADGIARGARKAFRDNPLIAGSVTALA